ncbi:hypothetical protein A3K48_04685 [candidate division WOR-1 bacterium RIFOXYA12_FULL_52_29]|uniref:Uncharacterized protein n=1 Tax=candidate division WOR-1 bacterium RIFOXYC12_FULL_54_18 TaxID=1802584 RepID=A0A1F4T668_UNCSA|nr:MAG: hypothetical protein A3K44_04685 [candidate division WOR-1 bacterium RIFOXYA2_FULL_51_19]OGC17845.1 MAG: hypothetical protein A3K48_04685 [candidate division WOR-1 bacterium RIFOXYA12_FULL_52_29]OGC26702.1 MAG: hypothetical protein A3K32_04680 [candidate division WOR-1 bacterium RIFOXYB2_FULL_45_9]OGC28262.1 MAG: hypothetical protein A3K49_04685 [candidate division WOR-1 bacterium RIFOXYC12_FULL_54_18]OGC31280.1 MAG: hypothetical protein A2346_07935 [candidate division WOR-1 bacterium R
MDVVGYIAKSMTDLNSECGGTTGANCDNVWNGDDPAATNIPTFLNPHRRELRTIFPDLPVNPTQDDIERVILNRSNTNSDLNDAVTKIEASSLPVRTKAKLTAALHLIDVVGYIATAMTNLPQERECGDSSVNGKCDEIWNGDDPAQNVPGRINPNALTVRALFEKARTYQQDQLPDGIEKEYLTDPAGTRDLEGALCIVDSARSTCLTFDGVTPGDIRPGIAKTFRVNGATNVPEGSIVQILNGDTIEVDNIPLNNLSFSVTLPATAPLGKRTVRIISRDTYFVATKVDAIEVKSPVSAFSVNPASVPADGASHNFTLTSTAAGEDLRPVRKVRITGKDGTVLAEVSVTPAMISSGNRTITVPTVMPRDLSKYTNPSANNYGATITLIGEGDRVLSSNTLGVTRVAVSTGLPSWRRYIGTEDTPGMVNPSLKLNLGTVPGDSAPVTLGSYSNFGLAPVALVRVVGPNGIIESPRLEIVAPLQGTFATDFDGNRFTDAGAGIGIRYAIFRGLQPGAYVLASGRKTHAEDSTRQFPTGDATNATFGLASSGFIGDRASYGLFLELDRGAFTLNDIEAYGGNYDGTRRVVRAGGQFQFNPVGQLRVTASGAFALWGEQSAPDTLAGQDYYERIGAQAFGLRGDFPSHAWKPYALLNIGRETLGDGDYAWNTVALTSFSVGGLFSLGRPEIWAGHFTPNHYVDESRNFLQLSYFPEFGESLPVLAPLGAHLQIADNGGGVTGMLTYDLVRGATSLFYGREVYKGQSRVGPYSAPLLPMGTPARYLTPNSALPSFQRPLNVRGASVPASIDASVRVGTPAATAPEKKSQ